MCVGLKRSDVTLDKAGGDDAEDTPVPIPNTEVKLRSADDTWRATARESRKLPAGKNNRSARVGYFFARMINYPAFSQKTLDRGRKIVHNISRQGRGRKTVSQNEFLF